MHRKAADRIEKLAEELGFSVERHEAQTGTIYLTIERNSARGLRRIKLRFSDHSDCYANTDYSADGVEGSPAGARQALMEKLGFSERSIRRLRRFRKKITAIIHSEFVAKWENDAAEQGMKNPKYPGSTPEWEWIKRRLA